MTSLDHRHDNGVSGTHVLTGSVVHRIEQLCDVLGRGGCLQILRILADGPVEVSRIIEMSHWPPSRVSKDLGELRKAGLIRKHTHGNHHLYELAQGVAAQRRDGGITLRLTTANRDVCTMELHDLAVQAALVLSFCLTAAQGGGIC